MRALSHTETAMCSDDDDFTFVIYNGKVKGCGFLQNYPNKAAYRISRYCARDDIRLACVISCGVCTCADDPPYQFTLDSGSDKTCGTFQLKTTLIRQQRYCFITRDKKSPSDIAKACPQSCGFSSHEYTIQVNLLFINTPT